MKQKKSITIFIGFYLLFFSNSLAETKNCLACSFSMSGESSKAGQADACDDLFGAACLEPDGKPKYQGDSKKLQEDLSKPIREARNKTAQAMGFKDIDDAVKTKLKEAGIVLKEPLDQAAWKELIGEGSTSQKLESEEIGKIFVSADSCNNELKALNAVEYYSVNDENALKATLVSIESFQAKYKEQSIKLYAKDLPNFISSHIGQNCTILKTNSALYKSEENEEIVKSCKNISQIRRQAVELFRKEGSAGYEKLAEQFVAENYLPALKFHMESNATASPATPPPEKSDLDKLKEKITEAKISNSSVCSGFNSNIENAGKKVISDLFEQIAKSKLTVDDVIGSFYSKDREKIATEIFRTAKSDIQDLTTSFVKDPKKRSDILDGFDNLKMYWMKKPDGSVYTKDKNGLLVLDVDKFSNPDDPTGNIFFDPYLSFFKTLNAYYTPALNYGIIKKDEQVNMMPGFISKLETNPYIFLSVIAHEAGHKIGKRISKVNGHDLSLEYQGILACYKDKKSIKLQDNQADETLADYFSSEILSRQIQKLPQEKRKQAMMSAMEDFCLFDDGSNQTHSVNCTGSHPENSLRVSGIYGANPSVRKILGCEKDSAKFKSCGLETSILEIAETNKSTGSPPSGAKQTDSKSSRGVK